jgi:hypothetical protein
MVGLDDDPSWGRIVLELCSFLSGRLCPLFKAKDMPLLGTFIAQSDSFLKLCKGFEANQRDQSTQAV